MRCRLDVDCESSRSHGTRSTLTCELKDLTRRNVRLECDEIIPMTIPRRRHEPMGARSFSGLITPFRPPLDFLASRIGSEDERPGILSLSTKRATESHRHHRVWSGHADGVSAGPLPKGEACAGSALIEQKKQPTATPSDQPVRNRT